MPQQGCRCSPASGRRGSARPRHTSCTSPAIHP